MSGVPHERGTARTWAELDHRPDLITQQARQDIGRLESAVACVPWKP